MKRTVTAPKENVILVVTRLRATTVPGRLRCYWSSMPISGCGRRPSATP
jgi:hypothetical protein